MIQTIIMTSDRPPHPLPGFIHLWQKYNNYPNQVNVICGFTKPDYALPDNFRFVSIGKQEDFPPNRWSERLHIVLSEVADEVFILMLDDYWLVRQVDERGLKMAYDYMNQFTNVLKIDLTFDRLFAEGGGKYLFGYHTYNTLGHLDLIKSNPASAYHMSLWGGMWRRDLLDSFLVPGETAQQIELSGTTRLAVVGDEVLVLGTRQAPMLHINSIQGREWNHKESGLHGLNQTDLEDLKKSGYDF